MKYIDANVFVYYLLHQESDKKRIAAADLLSKVVDGSLQAATSVLTWDEIMWVLRKRIGKDAAVIEVAKFLEFPNLRFLDVKESTISISQYVVKEYGIDPRDAIHIACCIENSIGEIISDDSDFDGVREVKRLKFI